jgi:hypothetical protein
MVPVTDTTYRVGATSPTPTQINTKLAKYSNIKQISALAASVPVSGGMGGKEKRAGLVQARRVALVTRPSPQH